MNDVPPGRPRAIVFSQADHDRGLPVALGAEAVAVGHEPLGGDARELAQAVEVLEGVGQGAEAALGHEGPQRRLDARGLPQASRSAPPARRLGARV